MGTLGKILSESLTSDIQRAWQVAAACWVSQYTGMLTEMSLSNGNGAET